MLQQVSRGPSNRLIQAIPYTHAPAFITSKINMQQIRGEDQTCSCGSMISGHRNEVQHIAAFSIETVSAGKPCSRQAVVLLSVVRMLRGSATADIGNLHTAYYTCEQNAKQHEAEEEHARFRGAFIDRSLFQERNPVRIQQLLAVVAAERASVRDER
jgi:hypothetical protein